MTTVALLAAMIGGVSLAPACHTLGPAAADGLVAAIDCEAQHFSTQLLAGSTAALASSGSGSGAGSGSGSAVATQGLTARASVAPASSTTGDPVQVRTAVSAAALVAHGEQLEVDGLVGPASLAAARRQGFARWRDVA